MSNEPEIAKFDWVFMLAIIACFVSVTGLGVVFVLVEMRKAGVVEQHEVVEQYEACSACVECLMFDAILDNLDALCEARK